VAINKLIVVLDGIDHDSSEGNLVIVVFPATIFVKADSQV
jgi:hypothetical protein